MFREVLECGGPPPLFHRGLAAQSGRGLPQSKTLARDAFLPLERGGSLNWEF